MLFLTLLSITSGCFPTVSTIYWKKEVYSNLYTFIAAPTAAGKSILNIGSSILNSHESFINEENEKIIAKNKENEDIKEKTKHLIIPGNCSYAGMIELLKNNNGEGIMIETEGSTVAKTFDQQWGDYSTVLLQCFPHEKLRVYRKTNDAYDYIEKPMFR